MCVSLKWLLLCVIFVPVFSFSFSSFFPVGTLFFPSVRELTGLCRLGRDFWQKDHYRCRRNSDCSLLFTSFYFFSPPFSRSLWKFLRFFFPFAITLPLVCRLTHWVELNWWCPVCFGCCCCCRQFRLPWLIIICSLSLFLPSIFLMVG